MIEILKKHYPYIFISFLLLFASSIGQTFFISLFNEYLIEYNNFDKVYFSYVYSIATLISALILPKIGKFMDTKPFPILAFSLLAGLGLGYIFLMFKHHYLTIGLVFIFIRLCGQSSLPLLSTNLVAKLFGRNRGRAQFLVSLGRISSEGLYPWLVALLIPLLGYSNTIVSFGFLAMVIIPFLLFFLIKGRNFSAALYPELSSSNEKTDQEGKIQVKKKDVFPIIFANATIPFALTGIFFHQADFKLFYGWSNEVWGKSFFYYSLGLFTLAFFSGGWVDKFSARKLYRFTLLPCLCGLLSLVLGIHHSSEIFLFGVGSSIGLSQTIKPSLYAEVFDLHHLGRLRSLESSFMVFTTAAAPVLFSYLLKWVGVNSLLGLLSIYGCLAAIIQLYVSVKFSVKSIS